MTEDEIRAQATRITRQTFAAAFKDRGRADLAANALAGEYDTARDFILTSTGVAIGFSCGLNWEDLE